MVPEEVLEDGKKGFGGKCLKPGKNSGLRPGKHWFLAKNNFHRMLYIKKN
jgi:hypothetical protein